LIYNLLKILKNTMQATISKWGNSQGLRIPKTISKSLNIDIGDVLNIEVVKDKMIIKPSKPKNKLDDLLAKMPSDYSFGEVFDDTIGMEKW
jgi:antitoxin MazE